VLVAVASSRQQHDTAQLAAAMEAESSAAPARDVLAVPRPTHGWDYFIGWRDAITQTMINTPAHPRSGVHRRPKR